MVSVGTENYPRILMIKPFFIEFLFSFLMQMYPPFEVKDDKLSSMEMINHENFCLDWMNLLWWECRPVGVQAAWKWIKYYLKSQDECSGWVGGLWIYDRGKYRNRWSSLDWTWAAINVDCNNFPFGSNSVMLHFFFLSEKLEEYVVTK